TIFNTGVPGPRPEVAQKLSTEYQGHILRMISLAESASELDEVLWSSKKHLRPVHIARSCLKLEYLRTKEKGREVSEPIKNLASELENYVELYSTKFTIGQVSQLVRGLSSIRRNIQPDLLLKLAAVVVADDGRQVQLANEMDCRDLFFGFFSQGFDNELFWKRLSESVLPRLPYFNADVVSTVLRVVSGLRFLHNTEFAHATMTALVPKVGDLSPARLADAFFSASLLDPTDVSGLNAKLEERFLREFTSFPIKDTVTMFQTVTVRRHSTPELAAQVAPLVAAQAHQLPVRHLRRALEGMVTAGWKDTAEIPLYAILAKQAARLVLGKQSAATSAILGKHVDNQGYQRTPVQLLRQLARIFANTGLKAGPGANQPLAPYFAALQRELEGRLAELDEQVTDDFAESFKKVGIAEGARVQI
nr:Chain AM, mL116 [Polytomella magna]